MATRRIPLYRPNDAARLIDMIAAGHCVTVVGLSNFGKSTLLRGLSNFASQYEEKAGRNVLFVYVDCHRILEMTIQGFYEVILRAILEVLPGSEVKVHDKIEGLYRRVVEPESSFGVPLAFNDSIVELMAETEFDVVLLLDEIDEVMHSLEPRIFLNMRALKDRYGERLMYVIATIHRAMQLADNDHVAEFGELFAPNELFLAPLAPAQTAQLASDIFAEAHDKIPDAVRDYILQMAGGHPGLTQAISQAILAMESHVPALYKEQAISLVDQGLENDRLVRAELNRLWNQITEPERSALVALVSQGPEAVSLDLRSQLVQRGIMLDENNPQLLTPLFTRYVQRQGMAREGMPGGVYLDTDAGEVWINGQRIQTLTDLEYRLLLLMYGRLDKMCDKYQIVEAVWGQAYIDEVDDARIEKLVSRLRAKIEPDPADPHYLLTVRGRGYKLTNGGSEGVESDED
ncbi:MAG TPA: winged helix-turn-helix domain-containing protein [Aggregatilineales bacterium]|nr:winged helix-turn-helix domain-containing protein [Aggregatilineales bacterium]